MHYTQKLQIMSYRTIFQFTPH